MPPDQVGDDFFMRRPQSQMDQPVAALHLLDLMLRALDLREGGATYRQIATELGRTDAARLPATEWKISAARSFVVRLVRDATAFANGDYRKLLRIR